MKKLPSITLVTLASVWAITAHAELVVDLDARDRAEGPIPGWNNAGALGETFVASGSPSVTTIEGVNGVTYNGSNWHVGPRSTPEMDGSSDRSIQVWLYNPAIASEETVVSWGHRGGPDGSNMSFNHGTHNAFGAVGHWGNGPDIGWDPSATDGDEDTGEGQEESAVWTNIAYTQTGSETRVFTNGVLTTSEEIDIDTHANQVIVVAAQQTGFDTNSFTLGGTLTIARLQIWDTALPDGQIAFNYNSEAANFGRDQAPITDSDGDGLPDDMEVAVGLNPNVADADGDADGDGVSNRDELRLGSNLNDGDTDGDGLGDAAEVQAGTSLSNADTDGDTISDKDEVDAGLDPTNADTDGDGAPDNLERDAGTDPTDPNDSPNTIVLVRDTTDEESWETAGIWSSGAGAEAGKQYVISAGAGSVLHSPKGLRSAFPAGSQLTLSDGGAQLILRNPRNARFDNLTLQAGKLSLGASRAGVAGHLTIGGDIQIDLSAGQRINIDSNLSGEGSFLFSGEIGSQSSAVLTGTSDGFTGDVHSNGVLLDFGGVNPIGDANVSTFDGGIRLTTNVLMSESSLGIGGTVFVIDLNDRIAVFSSFKGIDGGGDTIFDIPAGVYDRDALLGFGFNEDTVADSGGQLVILGDAEDTDGDGLWDQWETDTFGNLAQTPDGDPDGDELNNADEFRAGTDPTQADTDGDGLNDRVEVVESRSNPALADTDGDGLTDAEEFNRVVGGEPAPTDPNLADTDGDGLTDAEETNDGNFVSRTETGTDPLVVDTDGDGWADGSEIFEGGTDPTDPNDTPAATPSVVSLDARSLALGPIDSWSNLGGLGGSFQANGDPEVEEIDGVRGVTLDDSEDWLIGPPPPETLLGNSTRTIEAWVFNPEIESEETVVSWGRRGGPNGTNMSFNHGTHNAFGAIGHWGGDGPDIGWDPSAQADDEDTGNGREEANIWTHISYVWTGDQTRVFTNGILSNSESPGALNTWDESTAGGLLPIVVGNQNEADGTQVDALKGIMTISLIKIYDRAFTDDQILSSYNANATGFGRDVFVAGDDDQDGLSDLWELNVFGNLNQTADGDPDGDSVSNADEEANGTNPNLADSDGDGFTDREELDAGTDPLDVADFPAEEAQLLVSLDATTLPEGPISTWQNTGTLAGTFEADGGPRVITIDGVKGVEFDGTSYFEGPNSVPKIEGRSARTIEAWVHNPDIEGEETVVAWSRRGGPEGTNVSLNHGTNGDFGAVGHWGAPDIGWNGDQEANIWTHITYTYDGNTTRVYTNGQLSNEEDVVLNTAGGNGILIAAQREGDNETVTGGLRGSMTIAKVRIYDGALTGEEIAETFANEGPLFGRQPPVGNEDDDGDGLSNDQEAALGTSPNDPDSDNDGFSDGEENSTGTDPLDATDRPNAPTNTLVQLQASELPEGALASWANAGTLGGEFAAQGDPTVETIDGAKGVALDGEGDWLIGPEAPLRLAGSGARTIEAWVFNPEIASEETVVSWGRRGGPDGTNMSFNHGTHNAFGAVGHWGAPDIGWDPSTAGGDDDTGQGQEEASKWTHIAYTQDGSTTRVYTNGSLTNSEEGITLNTHGGQGIIIGAQWDNETEVNEALSGSLTVGFVRIYDGALTDAEIAATYAQTRGVFTDDGGVVIPGFVINSISRNDGGNVALTFATEAGRNYNLQYSETLDIWIDIGSIAGDGNFATVSDEDATRTSRADGYYRVALQP